jgi:tetratricopeptide (TPR) repeat protein
MDVALNHARKSLRLNPKLPMSFQVIGSIYMRKGKRKDAIKVLKQAAILDPKDKVTKYILSEAYLKLKDYNQAIKYANAALELESNLPGAHYNLAKCYLIKEDALNAMKHIDLVEKQYLEEKNIQFSSQARQLKGMIMKQFDIELKT